MIITKEEVDSIFEEAEKMDNPHQQDYAVALYRKVFPDWDHITSLTGWPRCGWELFKHTMAKAQEFDQKYHPDENITAGGLWFNRGWGCREEEGLGDWEVTSAHCVVETE